MEATKQRSWWRRHWLHILMFCIGIAALALVPIFGERFKDFAAYGILGVFLMALFGSIAPIWPLPGALAAFIAGGMGWPVPFIALAAGTAEPIGELTYYSIGYGSQPVLQKSKWYARLQGWMKRRGGLTIFLLSMIPNPIIRFADVAAAGLRYPLRKFIPFCWTGKMIKSFAFAAAGAGLFPALTHLAERIL